MKKALALLLAISFAPAAFGVLGLSRVLPDTLDQSDIDLMMMTAREKMDGKPVGTELRWQNSKTQNKGVVQLTDIFEINGKSCRSVKHLVKLAKDADNFGYATTLCKDGDEWVNLP